jgi:hypothetical protein
LIILQELRKSLDKMRSRMEAWQDEAGRAQAELAAKTSNRKRKGPLMSSRHRMSFQVEQQTNTIVSYKGLFSQAEEV